MNRTVMGPASVGLAGLVTVANTVTPSAATAPSRTDEHPVGAWDPHLSCEDQPAGRDGVTMAHHGRPGGSSGWHSHPGGAIIIVQQGTPTIYHAVDKHCETTTYNRGAGLDIDNLAKWMTS